MAVYVLVHGAWGGSYGFRAVRRLLGAAGHEVLTPSLTGLGERSHLAGPHVDLSLHVRDVVNVLHYDDLEDVVLLGFSYGGMVVTGAMEQAGARVRELVYLDAFVPDDGDSVHSLTGGALGDASPDAPPTVPAGIRTFDDPMVAARSNPRRHAQPMRTLTEPVRASVPVEERGVGLTYVRATQDPNGALFDVSAARARTSPAWRYHEIATTHMVPENRPGELAELLLALA
ncbi:alpha/beta hydrolase [Pseudonocardia broussonetiae]|uniref:Alpha/beta hydrolase n=1 Tax=Pseudonocardia broussonetiae TaxID=2736640 RepID=A0A6M6JBU8_9PSEU|nr:alpha/beta hydrolase [Pseudonocardia broussonetiae]QJY45026.1 alpha/beta hydrolase [Pseudonocardia broussonetiae]